MADKIRPREGVLLAVLVCAIAAIVVGYAARYDLLSPRSNYNDSNYYYVLAAPSVFAGPDLPRLKDPGATVMLMLAWYFRGLHAVGVLPAASPLELQASADPFRDMSRLFLAGKSFSLAVAAVYMALIYLLGKRLTGYRLVGGLCVLYSVLVVGVVEQMFMVRPEPLGAVLFLIALLISLAPGGHNSRARALLRVALVAFFFAASIMAKVLMVFFAPLLVSGAVGWFKGHGPLTTRRYLIYLGVLIAIDAVMAAPWLQLVSAGYVDSYRGMASFGALVALRRKALIGLVAVSAAAGGVGIASIVMPEASRGTRLLRGAYLIGLAVTAGAVASLYLFCLNGAQSRFDWARQIVFRAVGETSGMLALGVSAQGRQPDVSLVFNQELRHVAFGMGGATVLVVAGLWCATTRDRWRLLALAALLWGFSIVSTMRGYADFVFYYQILVLILVLLAVMVAARSLRSVAPAGHTGRVLAIVVALAVAGDAWGGATYRSQLFSRHKDRAKEMEILDYFGNGIFMRTVLAPRYCRADLSRDECYRALGQCLDEEQHLWHGWTRTAAPDRLAPCADVHR